jgi:cytochrome c
MIAGAVPSWADGDAALGEQVFKKCAACHSAVDKANKVGPSLMGVVGRKVASVEGYSYSDSMKEYGATGAVWDEKTLDTYLTDPKAVVAKTKMAFPGLKEQADRDNVIAFLKSKM